MYIYNTSDFVFQSSSQVQKAKISPTSDEYVLDQLSQCEEKLLKLLEELDMSGKDINELAKQMEEEEVRDYDSSFWVLVSFHTIPMSNPLVLSCKCSYY